MIPIHKPLSRVTVAPLGFAFGPDHNRPLVVTLLPGDVLRLKPHGTRRAELVPLVSVYRYAIRCRVATTLLVKANKAKEKKAQKAAEAKSRALTRAAYKESTL